MSLSINPFPDCCGIKIISGFGKTSNAIAHNIDQVTEVEKELNEIIKKQREGTLRSAYTAVGLLMVTLNHEQLLCYKEMMIRCGFIESVTPFFHPGHDSSISVFTMVLDEKKSFGDIESTKKLVRKKVNATVKAKKPTATVRSGGNPLDWRWTHE